MKTKIFWDWFNTNEPYIRKAVDERHSNASPRIFTDFFLVMEAYHPGISYLVETHPRRPDLYRMTLSAHGERSLFMPIKHLIDNAPHFPGWKFQAFFGPETDNGEAFDMWDSEYTFLGITFNPAQIQVSPQLYFSKIKKSLLLFLLPLRYSTYDQEKVEMAFEMFLMELIGEMTLYDNMASYDFTYYKKDEHVFVPMDCIHLIFEMDEELFRDESEEHP